MKKTAIVALSLGLLLFSPSLVLASNDNDSSKSYGRGESVRENVKKEFKSDLSDLRKKSCESRMENIKNRSNSLLERSSKMLEKFGSIATRVQDFYTNKVVPAGGTVSNYDALVSDIAAKKVAVEAALSDAKRKAQGFDCSDPSSAKTRVSEYRLAMQNVIKALKDYKTSVKNLIVAVRTAAKVVKPSPSPSPEL